MLKSKKEFIKEGNIRKLEKERKKIIKMNPKGIVRGSIWGGILIFIGLGLSFTVGFLGIVIIVVGVFVFFIVWIIIDVKTNKKLRINLFSKYINNINSSCEYLHGDKALSHEFTQSNFIPIGSFKTVEDVFRTRILNQPIKFGHISVSHIRNHEQVLDFGGWFAVIKTDKKRSFTTIYPNNTRKKALNIKFLHKNSDKNIQSQKKSDINSIFNKEFSVWTNDEQEARQILTLTLQNILFKKKDEVPVFLGWRDDKIFIGIDNIPKLKFKINKKITKKSVEEFYSSYDNLYNFFICKIRIKILILVVYKKNKAKIKTINKLQDKF